MLDLGLEHLDVDVGSGPAGAKTMEGVDVVVRACGDSKLLILSAA